LSFDNALLSFDNASSKQQEPNPNAALVKLVVAAGSQGEKQLQLSGGLSLLSVKGERKKGDLWNF
jgi:hypothetical protein